MFLLPRRLLGANWKTCGWWGRFLTYSSALTSLFILWWHGYPNSNQTTRVISIFIIVSPFVLWSKILCQIRYRFRKKLCITHRMSGVAYLLAFSISLKVCFLVGLFLELLFVKASLFTGPLLYFFLSYSLMFMHRMIIRNIFFTNEDWRSSILLLIAISICQCWSQVSSFYLTAAGCSCIYWHPLGNKRDLQNMVRSWETGQILLLKERTERKEKGKCFHWNCLTIICFCSFSAQFSHMSVHRKWLPPRYTEFLLTLQLDKWWSHMINRLKQRREREIYHRYK